MSKTVYLRTVKIQPLITPSLSYRRETQVKPMLKLSGNWLKDAGFEPGEHAVIIVKDGVMTVTPEDKYYLNQFQRA